MKELATNNDVMSLNEFASYLSKDLITWIAQRTRENKILVTVNDDYSPQNKMWDGEILITFLEPPVMTDVVNNCIGVARADEISMETANQLRLWWD